MDFMILYESTARELESACLLKLALEREGFSVGVYSIYSLRKSIKNARVIIVPHLYNDEQVYQFICKYKTRKCKVINLQYEQVISKKFIDEGHGFPTGEAVHGLVFAWGEHEYKRYRNIGLPNSVVTGCLPMDLNLSIYDKYFLSRKEIIQKYGLDEHKKILVFISSYALAEVSDEHIRFHYDKSYERQKLFADISRRSKAVTIKCLVRIANEEGYTVIYRPHIAEYDDPKLLDIEKRIENFHVISGESVRQWIRVADCLVNWFSTAIVDVYYACKPCIIFRPEEIPQDMDVPFLVGARKISNYNDLLDELHNRDSFPVDEKEIHEFYSNHVGEGCLENVVTACKEVYNSSNYEYEYRALPKFKTFRKTIKTFCVDILFELSRYIDLTNVYRLLLRNNPVKQAFFEHIQKEMLNSDKTIKEICLRLSHGE